MREILAPFMGRRGRLQMALCCAVFIAMAVPFKVMVLIQGLTEVRPVNAVPIVAGLLMGPAGAWGCAVGNLIADLFGTFSAASVPGFFANFLAAYLPYRLWHLTGDGGAPDVKSGARLLKFAWIALVTALATAALLLVGLRLLRGEWLMSVFWIVLFNNAGFSLLFGLPVLILLTSDEIRFQAAIPKRRQK